jgi:hypothetical protein
MSPNSQAKTAAAKAAKTAPTAAIVEKKTGQNGSIIVCP